MTCKCTIEKQCAPCYDKDRRLKIKNGTWIFSKNECSCSEDNNPCRHCYDKKRRHSIKNGTWNFNKKPPEELCEIQKQVLIGGLLGDLNLSNLSKGKNSCIKIQRAFKDKGYLEYQHSVFENFCESPIKYLNRFDKITKITRHYVRMHTQCAKVFTDYYNRWYPKNKKIVPKDFQLTPLICAIWFCDDGTVSQYGVYKDKIRISLYTENFIKSDVEYLISLLSKEMNGNFRLHTIRYKNKSDKDFYPREYYRITMYSNTAINFVKYIDPQMPKSMSRKSNLWQGLLV